MKIEKLRLVLFCFAFLLIILFISSVSALVAKIGNARIIVNVKTGETLQKSIKIINDNPVPVKIELVPSGEIKDAITIRNNNFILKPNSEKNVYFIIKAVKYGKNEGHLIVKFTPIEGGEGVAIPAEIIIISRLDNELFGDEAGQKLVDYLNQGIQNFNYISYKDIGLLYEINLSYKNESDVVYMTKDGKYFIPIINQIDNSTDTRIISPKEARIKLIDYLNKQLNGGVKYISYSDKGFLYQIKVSYMKEKTSVYMAKDGKYIFMNIYEIKKIKMPRQCRVDSDCVYGQMCKVGKCIEKPVLNPNPPNTDYPKVQVFVFSYCPYALQFEKGLFPVYDLLKNKADINIAFIGAMHGEVEHVESLRQICIEKNYEKDKLFSYLKQFDTNSNIGACSGNDSCVNRLIEEIYTSLGIDKNMLNNCIAKDAEAIYEAQENNAINLDISGSPTLVINDVQVVTGRDPASILKTICSSFKTKPAECSTKLSSNVPSAGFGPASSSSGGGGGSGGGCG